MNSTELNTDQLIETIPEQKTNINRLQFLQNDVTESPKSICAERALFITEYFKDKANKDKPMVIRKAEAMAYMLNKKAVKIYPQELIVGTTTSKRVAGPIFPELHGVAVLEDIFRFNDRDVNPLEISRQEKSRLLKEVVPFWLTKFLAYKSFSGVELVKFMQDQLNPKFYLINETGGIGHLIPDHETVLNIGLEGLKGRIKEQLERPGLDPQTRDFNQAMVIACDGVIRMAENYSRKASEMAEVEKDSSRKQELLAIAEVLMNVPKRAARTFHEAIQSLWMLHISIFLEGLDNGISFGRSDQYLYPFYKRDLENGTITRDKAKELTGCFAIKSSEIIPVFSKKITECHGGFLSGQAMTIGGVDKNGKDVTNELSYLILEVMDEVRMRQPNYHARIHDGSPDKYLSRIMHNLVKGVTSPALYNDDLIIRSLQKCGFGYDDAMEYGTLGCVELGSPGKTFGSTDAALVNIPICLEMALNRGKLFRDSIISKGLKTEDPKTFNAIEDVQDAFALQLQFVIDRLVKVLEPIETGNRKYHPTPLTSVMIRGCIEAGKDVTEGGAIYNFSGVQGVGVTDTGDSLYALDQLVFVKKKYPIKRVIRALKNDFAGEEKMRVEMHNLGKFGNDIGEVDVFSRWVVDTFYDSFNRKVNTRGGQFVAGFYSTTTHYSFGTYTGALPCGRRKGQPFTSGIAPLNGCDKKGPTALFNSITAIDFLRAHNGVNVNVKFDAATLKGETGEALLRSLLLTYLKKGGMQIQVNVLDSKMLEEAKENPDKYSWLIVRVSGYSAYFNDLSPAMKDEIIKRSSISC